MLHRFKSLVIGIKLPDKFTWPFHYSPHTLCRIAAKEVQDYILSQTDWIAELQQGKMFGVLVVKDENDELGYIAAFSGNLMGKNYHEHFVPPIYDALQPGDFFKTEEKEITKINHLIDTLNESNELISAQRRLMQITKEAQNAITQHKEFMSLRKTLRDKQRESGTDETLLVLESQKDKADLHRLKKHYKSLKEEAEQYVDEFHKKINALQEERKMRSTKLQMKLFQQYRLLNAKGEYKDICDIFYESNQSIPPAGAGECAAPKLLQYAYLNKLRPIAMAEFWWGNSPKGEIRKHGGFYPACISKCKPILLYMMKGLNVESNPLEKTQNFNPKILWEDEYVVVVNKPCGMLSVCGKIETDSVEQWAKRKYPDATGPLIVHRLDQSTSGVLVVAKNKEVHKQLQHQFLTRQVKKSYIAILDGIVLKEKGEINLPLKLDYEHRPCQMVSSDGKKAKTEFEIITVENGKTRVRFYPITGRTHQLRVHSAHKDGLGIPIVGDELYGTSAERLCLHAEYIEFVHPITHENIEIRCASEF